MTLDSSKYIDTHCHLTFQAFDDDRDLIIGNAKKAGVKQFICPGVDMLSSKLSVDLSLQHPGVVYSAVGFHPYEAQSLPNTADLESLLNEHVVAIGECGLDYHQYKGEAAEGKKSNQKRIFQEHLQLARKHNFPLIMHCRDAFEDFFDCLDAQPELPRGVIHCFTGGLQDVRFAIDRKLLFGVDGNITYSKQLQSIIPHIPLDMLLLETDAPYLTPVPFRGDRNEPKYIPLISEAIAKLKETTPSSVALQTTLNAHTLFHFH